MCFWQVRAFSFASGGLIAAREMHNKLLMSVLHAPVSWFDASPTGRTLNRFSSDVGAAGLRCSCHPPHVTSHLDGHISDVKSIKRNY